MPTRKPPSAQKQTEWTASCHSDVTKRNSLCMSCQKGGEYVRSFPLLGAYSDAYLSLPSTPVPFPVHLLAAGPRKRTTAMDPWIHDLDCHELYGFHGSSNEKQNNGPRHSRHDALRC